MSSHVEQWPPPNDATAFELLCLALWRELWRDPNAQQNGRSGQPQAGVDIYGQSEGEWIGVQCKKKGGHLRRNVTVKELETEVRAATRFIPRLSDFILATTGPRDARVQERAREISERNKGRSRLPRLMPSGPPRDTWKELRILWREVRDISDASGAANEDDVVLALNVVNESARLTEDDPSVLPLFKRDYSNDYCTLFLKLRVNRYPLPHVGNTSENLLTPSAHELARRMECGDD